MAAFDQHQTIKSDHKTEIKIHIFETNTKLDVECPSFQINKVSRQSSWLVGMIQFGEAGWRLNWNVGAKEMCHIGNESVGSCKINLQKVLIFNY